jgi:hypothetical protein
MSSDALIKLTHAEEPWMKARGSLSALAPMRSSTPRRVASSCTSASRAADTGAPLPPRGGVVGSLGVRQAATTPPAAARSTPRGNILAQAFYQAGLDSSQFLLPAQVLEATSISAGLDYPGVGPEHAMLAANGRAEYYSATAVEPVNGPSLEAEEEDDSRLTVAADGFQGIEEGLFPAVDPARRDSLLKIATALQAQLTTLIWCASTLTATLLDAVSGELVQHPGAHARRLRLRAHPALRKRSRRSPASRSRELVAPDSASA